ncbi:UNVERIFIED_CONTAM: hypothetical protein Cloal_0840 [Acetivibrio alkalicellulosi]
MINKITTTLKHGGIIFSVLFTITTLVSSSLQLYQGKTTDTNLHILNRAVVVLIGVITIILFHKFKTKSKILTYLIPYAISMGVVFLYVWFVGFFETLHPNAYRDIFFNFTGVTVFVIIVIKIKEKVSEYNKKQNN